MNDSADPGANKARARIQKLARLLDSSIRLPGGYRIGLDGLMGLIPGIGDFAGLLASSYLVMLAARSGIPRATLVLMVYNILIETAVGSVPFVGDIFDFVWKANERNLALYDKAMAAPDHDRQRNRVKAAAPILVFIGLVVAGTALLVAAVRLLVRLIGG